MPRSKREKEVSLTKVKKKGKEMKSKLVDEVRAAIDNHQHCFLFSVDNMRNSKLKDVRQHFKTDSRFFFGKNTVMALALGRIAEEEYQDNLHQVSRHMNGQCGLLLTNKPKDEVIKYFRKFSALDFARAGNVASLTVSLSEGPLEYFPFSIEPQLRKLGLPTTLQKGVVTLTRDHVVCKAGNTLTPEQTKILKLMNVQMANFKLNLICSWSKPDGDFQILRSPKKKTKPTKSTSSTKKKRKQVTQVMETD